MTRNELLSRIVKTRNSILVKGKIFDDAAIQELAEGLGSLIEDIVLDGVLDVQAPEDIAESMNLPRPRAGTFLVHKPEGLDYYIFSSTGLNPGQVKVILQDLLSRMESVGAPSPVQK